MNIRDWLWICSVDCDVCVYWKRIFRIIPIGCEHLRITVNIFSWMWCVWPLDLNLRMFSIECEYVRWIVNNWCSMWWVCTVELNFTNIFDWTWILAINREYLESNVMYVYSGTEVYEYCRIDVNIGDRLWIFLDECDVCAQRNWNFTNVSDWMWIFAIDCEYIQLNVMFEYSRFSFYEYFRLDVNICDRIWLKCTADV